MGTELTDNLLSTKWITYVVHFSKEIVSTGMQEFFERLMQSIIILGNKFCGGVAYWTGKVFQKESLAISEVLEFLVFSWDLQFKQGGEGVVLYRIKFFKDIISDGMITGNKKFQR